MKKSFLILLVLSTACVKPEEHPADLIPKDSMAQILVNIHISEAKVATRPMHPDSTYLFYEVYKKDVYKKYKISPERFQKSFDYYLRNLDQMDQIYETVVDSLGLMEGRGRLE